MICIKTTGQSYFFKISIILLSNNSPLISFIRSAPALHALSATDDLVVSIEITVSVFFLNLSITDKTLVNSSSSDTGSENGLVDSPPISIMSAPLAIISIA